MLTLPPSVQIWLATEPVDLRRGFDGLSAIVRHEWKRDIFAGHLFVFFGKRLDRCKVLLWTRVGQAIYYTRLEQGRFRIPGRLRGKCPAQLDATELAMLLDGIDIAHVRRTKAWVPPMEVHA